MNTPHPDFRIAVEALQWAADRETDVAQRRALLETIKYLTPLTEEEIEDQYQAIEYGKILDYYDEQERWNDEN
ncbi:hypothetical protein H0X32_04325 [Patescibacteria group bacterium]|nr:hypothetical protein [Patescibacteria group bacterium]